MSDTDTDTDSTGGAETGPDTEREHDAADPARHAIAVLEHVVKSVVDDPDAVKVSVESSSDDAVALTVEVGPGDMGRVIGRRGRIANAIRTVVRAAGVRDGKSVDVEFLD